jgi:autotransporter-associated beta strand protein
VPDPGGGSSSFVQYVGSTAGDLWSVSANWLDENNTHRAPKNGDDIFIGSSTGTNTTDNISLVADYLDFYRGTNLLTVSGGVQLVIFPTSTVGIAVDPGVSAFIDVTNNSDLQLSGTASANGVSLELDGGGKFSISSVTGSGVSIGDLQGANGTIDLGAKMLTVGSLNTFTNYYGTISGVGGSLTKVGTGALTLASANTYSGSTNIQSGTLAIGDNAALGTSALTIGLTGGSNNVKFNIATANPNVANNITVSALAGGATATIASLEAPASGPNQVSGNVTLNGSLGIDTTAFKINPFTFTGTITGNGGVTINPNFTGAVSFTGANGYSGNTTVNGGTFFANNTSGSATGTGSVTVAGGATLAGNGSITGVVTVNSGVTLAGGTLTPGNSGVGTLHIGNSALTTPSLLLNGTLSLEIGGIQAGSDYGQIITATGATISGNLSLAVINGFRPLLGEKFYIIDNTSSDPALRTTGSFANAPGGMVTDNAGDTYEIVYAGIEDPSNASTLPNDVTLVAVNVVPEPATIMLLIAGCVSLALARLLGRTRLVSRHKI